MKSHYISQFRIKFAANEVRQGGIVAYPTEAVFGLGCDPLNQEAVEGILALKQRSMDKGLIVIASNIQQILPYIDVSDDMLKKLSQSWPGPVTWVCPIKPWVPEWLTGTHQSLAVRVSDHPLVNAFCNAAGTALVSTSANPEGRSPALSAVEVRNYFSSFGIHVLNGSLGERAQPSSIFDARTGKQLR